MKDRSFLYELKDYLVYENVGDKKYLIIKEM